MPLVGKELNRRQISIIKVVQNKNLINLNEMEKILSSSRYSFVQPQSGFEVC